jgi:hypothetical protein
VLSLVSLSGPQHFDHRKRSPEGVRVRVRVDHGGERERGGGVHLNTKLEYKKFRSVNQNIKLYKLPAYKLKPLSLSLTSMGL